MIQKLSALLRGAEEEVKPPQRVVVFRSVAAKEAAKATVSVQASAPKPEVPVATTEPQQEIERNAAGVKKVVLNEATLSILDLPSSRLRILGSGCWVTDSGRSRHGGSDYLMVRGPKNKYDPNAVAGQKIIRLRFPEEATSAAYGLVGSERAARMARML